MSGRKDAADCPLRDATHETGGGNGESYQMEHTENSEKLLLGAATLFILIDSSTQVRRANFLAGTKLTNFFDFGPLARGL